MERGLAPHELHADLLSHVCSDRGFTVQLIVPHVAQLFSSEHNLHRKTSSGSTHPHAVHELLVAQLDELQQLQHQVQTRCNVNTDAYRRVDALLFNAPGS
jgi:hypothetical protein